MITFNEWFLSLHQGHQAVLREDKWMLANSAFAAGAQFAREECAKPESPTYEYMVEIQDHISNFTYEELTYSGRDALLHKIMVIGKGKYNPEVVKNILNDRFGAGKHEPNGGNMYRAHVFYLPDKCFWRCEHGLTGLGAGSGLGCIECYHNFIKYES